MAICLLRERMGSIWSMKGRKVFSIFNLLKFSHLDEEYLDQRRNGVGDDSEIKQKARRSQNESCGETFDILIATKSRNLKVLAPHLSRPYLPQQESFPAMFVIHYSQNQIKSNIIKVVSGAEERLEIETTRNLLEQFEYKISLLV